MHKLYIFYFLLTIGAFACNQQPKSNDETRVMNSPPPGEEISPRIMTETTLHDTDDPAIWINYDDPAQSLILGTDKDAEGALYVFDLKGKILADKVIDSLQRPNNVDVEYGLMLNGQPTDIAVLTERLTSKLRIFSLPDMKPIDGGGIPVFEGESSTEYRDLMGIALYKRPSDNAIFAIVGRKNGPTDGTYLWQYLLQDNGSGEVKATLVRKFGNFSGTKEIEAIAVDDSLGYVYYSDEQVGVRKYNADPERGNEELALFGTEGFTADHEGISIYAMEGGKGYILVSDQEVNKFHIFSRDGWEDNPHDHRLLKIVTLSTVSSDGSETVNYPFSPQFPHGFLVAMSEGKTFHLYHWEDIAGDSLMVQTPKMVMP